MNKEQFESLTKFIEGRTSILSVADAIEIWFEQNPTIEPVVVGLSDEQVEGFMTFWADSPSSDYIGLYKKWAKSQTFAEPYDLESLRIIATDLHDRAAEGFKKVVKEITITVGLSDEKMSDLAHYFSHNMGTHPIDTEQAIFNWAKTQTFAHCNNEGKVYELDGTVTDYKAGYERVLEDFIALTEEYSKLLEQPVVVGLTDEQVDCLAGALQMNNLSSAYRSTTEKSVIDEYLKTQTFTQSRVFTDSEIQQNYMELYDDYQSLLVDNQQFQPNWDNDAPQQAEVLVLTSTWLNKSRQRVGEITSQKFYRPKPPAPTVEVGQVWMHNTKTGCDYIVTTIGKFKDSHDECVDSVTYHSKVSDMYYTRTRDDFLARFELVQS